jgi:hypothetical protein
LFNTDTFQGFLGIIFAFAGAMLGDFTKVNEGIQAALEAGIKIAEIMEELVVSFFNFVIKRSSLFSSLKFYNYLLVFFSLSGLGSEPGIF